MQSGSLNSGNLYPKQFDLTLLKYLLINDTATTYIIYI